MFTTDTGTSVQVLIKSYLYNKLRIYVGPVGILLILSYIMFQLF